MECTWVHLHHEPHVVWLDHPMQLKTHFLQCCPLSLHQRCTVRNAVVVWLNTHVPKKRSSTLGQCTFLNAAMLQILLVTQLSRSYKSKWFWVGASTMWRCLRCWWLCWLGGRVSVVVGIGCGWWTWGWRVLSWMGPWLPWERDETSQVRMEGRTWMRWSSHPETGLRGKDLSWHGGVESGGVDGLGGGDELLLIHIDDEIIILNEP